MPLTAGELTNRLKSRHVFADYTRQKEAAQLGLRTPLRIQSFNGGVNPALAYQQAVEGAAYTSREEELSYIAEVNPHNIVPDPVIVPPGVAQWATSIGSTGTDIGNSITVDLSGNVYVTGSFSGIATIKNFSSGGDGENVILTDYGKLTSSGGTDIFIVKYNSSGTAQWATSIGSPGTDNGTSITVDTNGSVYVTGFFSSTMTIRDFVSGGDGGDVILASYGTLASAGSFDAFIVKYSASGTAQWATPIGSTNNESVNSVSVDLSGNVYVTGSFNGTVTIRNFGSGGGGGAITLTSYGTLTTAGNADAFIVKYNSSGTAQWATSIGSVSPSESGNSIATDGDGNVYVVGQINGTVSINNFISGGGGGAITLALYGTLATTGGTDAFIVKYNSSGTAQWATTVGSSAADTGRSIAVDTNGFVYITGQYSGIATIRDFSSGGGGGAITLTPYGTLTSAGGTDAFIVKYSSSGSAQWATSIGSISADIGYSVATDGHGSIYVAGQYASEATIRNFGSGGGGGAINLTPYGKLTSAGNTDAFLVKYNSSGIAQWATSIGSTSADVGFSVATDGHGFVYVTGQIIATATINNFISGGDGEDIILTPYGTLTSAGLADAFIVKYSQ
jgi:hypothetical protein